MKLVYDKTGNDVKVKDRVTLRDGEGVITAIEKPHKPSSTGRVYVCPAGVDPAEPFGSRGFFPSIIGAHWVDREDRGQGG